MNNYYNHKYFKSAIFDYDYKSIADAIWEIYHPSSVIEFGCGNGDLSIALAEKGIAVVAIDGFSTPNFIEYPEIKFTKVDLNDIKQVKHFLTGLTAKFDVAISLEVAEHLNPEVSRSLIENMTSVADIAVFSAAVINQGGDGHINCKPREYWHNLFLNHDFLLADRIREKIRYDKTVARWFRHNIIDYCKIKKEFNNEDFLQLIGRLIASDSAASSDYYATYEKLQYKEQLLRMQPMRFIFKIRNLLKTLIGKEEVPLDKPE